MYKIYINSTPLFLMNEVEARTRILANGGDRELTARYLKKSKTLLNYADMLEKGGNKHLDSVAIYSDDLELLMTDFAQLFQIIEAAGGVVQNEKQETLLIFRRGSWDLPKGKLDEGESSRQGAAREVEEETGVRVLMGDKICTTWHTYSMNGNRILKRTKWYRMTLTDESQMAPQADEGIEKLAWLDRKQAQLVLTNSFSSIRYVLEQVGNLKVENQKSADA